MEGAVFYRAYRDEGLVSDVTQQQDPDQKNILKALGKAAAPFARARTMDETLGGTEITQDIIRAIHVVKQAREMGASVDQFFQQGNMLQGEEAVEVKRLAMFFDENMRSGRRMGETLERMGTLIEEHLQQQTTEQIEGIGEIPPLDKISLIEQSINLDQGDMWGFDQAAEDANKQRRQRVAAARARGFEVGTPRRPSERRSRDIPNQRRRRALRSGYERQAPNIQHEGSSRAPTAAVAGIRRGRAIRRADGRRGRCGCPGQRARGRVQRD